MKKLYLMEEDGKSGQGPEYHLFLWDSATAELYEIAEGRYIKTFDDSSAILLGNDESDLQVYQVKKDELQIIPVHSKNVELIQGIICCERAGRWYGWVNGQEVELGEKRELGLSYKACAKLGVGSLSYFIRSKDKFDYVLSFVINSVLLQGTYTKKHLVCDDFLLAYRSDGNFDIYNAGVPYVYDSQMYPNVRSNFKDKDNFLYFWDESKTSWCQLASDACFLLADNALVARCSDAATNKRYYILYKIEGITKTEMRRGSYKLCVDWQSFEIDGMIYSINCDSHLVDFDNPRPMLKQKIKDLIQKLWKYRK